MPKKGEMFRVVSDGTTHGTMVYWPDGKPMGAVQELTVHIRAGELYADITQLNIGGVEIPTVPIVAKMDMQLPATNVNLHKVIPD